MKSGPDCFQLEEQNLKFTAWNSRTSVKKLVRFVRQETRLSAEGVAVNDR